MKELSKKNKNNFSSLVSVIIPCYNNERFVETAVRSIMEQTYTNLEILCCDDCSTDNTLAILKRLAKEDQRIKILRNEKNLKLVSTLNKLVAAATGKYIARMDSDDISLPNRIEKQLAFMHENPEIDFCGCYAFHINESGEIIGKSNVPESYDDMRFFLPFFSTFLHPTVFAKAEVFKNNPYDKGFPHAEDYELWCRLIFKKGVKGANIPEMLFKYRINPNSVSRKYSTIQAETVVRIRSSVEFMVEKSLRENVFFLHKTPVSKEEYKTLKPFLKTLRSKKMSVAYILYSKILYHFKCQEQWNLFIKLTLCPLGIYTLVNIMIDKFKRSWLLRNGQCCILFLQNFVI